MTWSKLRLGQSCLYLVVEAGRETAVTKARQGSSWRSAMGRRKVTPAASGAVVVDNLVGAV